MNETLNPDDRIAIERIVHGLETAWNAGDGVAFGALMAPDAQFVTIRAEHIRGRDAIAAGHTGIFRTVFVGSTIRYTIKTARSLAPDVALVHVPSELHVPAGPLAGRHDALFSAVLTRTSNGWLIASFHNTLAPAKSSGPRPG